MIEWSTFLIFFTKDANGLFVDVKITLLDKIFSLETQETD